jgi:hypothetical protein
MKRFANILAWTLALNFLAVAGGAAYLWRAGRLDREKTHAIREILFPPPAPPTTQPSRESLATTQPTLKLDDLIARTSGLPAADQIALIRKTFDAQMSQLDRTQRGLIDLQRTVQLAQEKLARDRTDFEQQKKALVDKEKQAELLAADKGFQDTLAIYNSMQPKQVKSIFMTIDDATMMRYLQAMEPRAVSKISKEFKTPDEVSRISKVLEQMRQAQAQAQPANPATSAQPNTP